MTKNTKIYFVILISVFFSSIGSAFLLKNSFIGSKNLNVRIENVGENNINFFINTNDEDKYFNNKISSLDELEKNSNLIVEGKITDRKLFLSSFETKFEISKIYKNNGEVKESEYIYVHEPIGLVNDNFNSVSGYNYMKENVEYILFLKKLPKIEGFKYPSIEKISYIPVSPMFSKFSNGEDFSFIEVEEDKQIKYDEIKKFGIVFDNKENFEKYKLFKNEVEKKYN